MYNIYSDETRQWDFNVITWIFWEVEFIEILNNEILDIIRKRWSKELKFNWLRSYNHLNIIRECFEKIFPLIWNNIRIYSIVWDRTDSRYDWIRYVDEDKDFDIMMYHLIHWISRRTKWKQLHCFPDHRNQSKWEDIKFFLENKKIITQKDKKMIKDSIVNVDDIDLDQTIDIWTITWVDSKDNWLVQLADIITWLIWLSHLEWEWYYEWVYNKKNKDLWLFPEISNELVYSNKKIYKFKALEMLDIYCKKYKLQISLHSEKKLVSKRDNWFFIHHYKSQSIYDSAPSK